MRVPCLYRVGSDRRRYAVRLTLLFDCFMRRVAALTCYFSCVQNRQLDNNLVRGSHVMGLKFVVFSGGS
jgi:hypothetical protein